MIIGVTALARAGKDVFADYVVEKYGFRKANFSDVLHDALVEEGREPTKAAMAELGDEWRKKYGMDIVARKTFEKLKGYGGNVILLGMRSPAEVNLARELCEGKFALIAVTADKEVRYQRRSSADADDKEEFFKRDEIDMRNKGLDKVIDMAEYTVENNSTKEAFYSKIDNIMEEVKNG